MRALLLLLVSLSALADALRAQQGGGASDVRSTRDSTAVVRPRPGDRVVLKVWNEPQMSDTFNISERGEVILPRLGAVHVTDQPIVALQDSLRRAYAVYLRNPSVEIVVLRRIGVQGEVRYPGIYLADLTMGLPEVIARAGGFTEAGNPRNILVFRNGERIRYEFRGDTGLRVSELQSGDQIVVRRRSELARSPMTWIGGVIGLVGAFRIAVWPMIESILDDENDGNP